jgi:hypothetical protein
MRTTSYYSSIIISIRIQDFKKSMRIHKDPEQDTKNGLYMPYVVVKGTSRPRTVPTTESFPSNLSTKLQRTFSCNEHSKYLYLEPLDKLADRVHVVLSEAESLRGDGDKLVADLVPRDVAQQEFSCHREIVRKKTNFKKN